MASIIGRHSEQKQMARTTEEIPLTSLDAETPSIGDKKIDKKINVSRQWCWNTGWRFGVPFSAWTAVTICLLNIILAIWLSAAHPSGNGDGIMYSSDCDTIGRTALGIDLLINLLSTILLAASNYTMQCLAAPTRTDCDRAHARYDWLDIGVNSVRNLFKIQRWRSVLWAVLACTSLPIHLLYNSVIYKVLAANEYQVAVVNQAFLDHPETPIWIPALTTYYSKSCSLIDGVAQRPNTTITSTNFGDALGSECHLTDCGLMPSVANATGHFGMPTTIKDLLNYCLGSSDCAYVMNNGTPESLNTNFTSEPFRNETLWSSCHFSDCQSEGGNVTYAGIMDSCEPESTIVFLGYHTQDRSTILAMQARYINYKSLYTELPISACLQSCGQDLVSQYGNLFMVNNDTSSQSKSYALLDTVSIADSTGKGESSTPYSWMCPDQHAPCDVHSLLQNSTYEQAGQQISHCVAEVTTAQCSLHYNISLLVIVIICNAIKAVCMFLTVLWCSESPVTVLGDAIASYLRDPDPSSGEHDLMSARSAKKYLRSLKRSQNPQPQHDSGLPSRPPYLLKSVTVRQLVSSLSFIVLYMIIGGILLNAAVQGIYQMTSGSQTAWSYGIGTANTQLTLPDLNNGTKTTAKSLISAVLTANTPQLLLSISYLLYNSLVSSMFLTKEWSSYGAQKKALRVSTPSGLQRSTYFLQLPYKFGVPLLVISVALHWLVSQTIFLVRVDLFKNGLKDADNAVTALGYSPLPILISILLGIVLLVAVACIGFRRAESSMPLAGSNSFAIAAACHPPDMDPVAAMLFVQWGQLDGRGDADLGHCTFTTHSVRMPTAESLHKRSV